MAVAHWRWLFNDSDNATLRYGIGYTFEKHVFSRLDTQVQAESNGSIDTDVNAFLPNNRENSYPFVSIEYVQKDYRKLVNVNLINQIEDFNLGWHATALIGTDISSSDFSPLALWQSSLSKGLQTTPSGYLFFNASFEGEFDSKQGADNRYLLTFSTEYFHQFSQRWGGYIKNANTITQRPFLDDPVALGDESGVRGYPLQYQHGSYAAQITIEARYYPHINIYKLFELGGAAFIDAGKAFGNSPIENINQSVLTSVGLGARLYSTHSSEAQVIHFDIVKPLSGDSEVNSLEFRVTTKHSF